MKDLISQHFRYSTLSKDPGGTTLKFSFTNKDSTVLNRIKVPFSYIRVALENDPTITEISFKDQGKWKVVYKKRDREE